MTEAKSLVLVDDGSTKLWGWNVGIYPWHRFLIREPGERERSPFPLRLVATGWDEWVEGCERRRSNSPVFAIEYVKEGRFEFVQNGRKRLVAPGGVFLSRLGCDTEMRTPDKFARKRTMIAEGPCVEAILAGCGLAEADVVEGVDVKRLDSLFDRAEELFTKAPPGFMRQASTLVYETLLALGEGVEAGRGLPAPVRKALELFESRIWTRVSLDELEESCGCSAVTLQRLFRRHLGETPLEKFIGMKMKLAKDMLLLSSEPVKELARRLGYSNQLYFSTEFRKRTGVSPREWRRRKGA